MLIDYQIAVIGAGIIGASIAAKLASEGISVALLDKGVAAGQGASSYSAGLVRLYDSDPLLMELAAYSIGLMNQDPFASTYASALRRTGAIYRAAPDQLHAMCRAIEQYASDSYPMRLLPHHELDGIRYPRCAGQDQLNLYEPRACVGNVRQAVAALANQVRRTGLVLEHCEVEALECRSRHEVRLALGDTTLRCQAVVVAAGAWSQRFLPPLGLHARSIPLARVRTEGEWTIPLIDAVTQSYGIPLTSSLVQTGCGFRATAEQPCGLPWPDARHVEDARARVESLVGATQLHVLDVLPGFDSYSPDGRPLLGFCDDTSPVYLATGMSGLGFKLAPGIAQIAFDQLCCHLAASTAPTAWPGLSPQRLTGAGDTGAGFERRTPSAQP